MKFLRNILSVVGVLAVIGLLTAGTTRYLDRRNLLIENFEADQVKLMIRTVSPTTNLIEALDDTTTLFAVPSTGILPLAYGGTAAASAAAARTSLGIAAQTGGVYTNIGIYGATVTGSFTNADLTASLPVWTETNKALVSKSVAATLAALGTGVTTNGNMSGMSLHGSTTNSGLTASLPVFTDANKVLASVTVANTKIALGIDSGSATAAGDGAVTNAFNFTFSSAPKVVLTEYGAAAATLNIVITNVTTTNFITLGDASGTYYWIAVGAP